MVEVSKQLNIHCLARGNSEDEVFFEPIQRVTGIRFALYYPLYMYLFDKNKQPFYYKSMTQLCTLTFKCKFKKCKLRSARNRHAAPFGTDPSALSLGFSPAVNFEISIDANIVFESE